MVAINLNMDKMFLEYILLREIRNIVLSSSTEEIKFCIVNLSSIDYLTRPFAPSVFSESTLLPSMRIYAKEPRKPAPKLNT